jgi:DNA polymerase-3 subunit beta
MNIDTNREALNGAMTRVGGVVERRQTLPILGNLLFTVRGGVLEITGTDLEIEVKTRLAVDSDMEGEFTLPARKIIDICRALPEGAPVKIDVQGERAVVRSEKSRFVLGTLPAADYPSKEAVIPEHAVELDEGDFKRLLEKTGFAMAQQDVRYYLNGLLLEITDGKINAVATDGHRLAMASLGVSGVDGEELQSILPRKTVLELSRLLGTESRRLELEFGCGFFRVGLGDTSLTSKLIEGRYPEYRRVIPRLTDKVVLLDRESVRHALLRTAILSNEKYRGVRLTFEEGVLRMQAHNPEQEEAEDELAIEYTEDKVSMGFNVSYLLDVLAVLETDLVEFKFSESGSSALLTEQGGGRDLYVVMPMRL